MLVVGGSDFTSPGRDLTENEWPEDVRFKFCEYISKVVLLVVFGGVK